MRRSEPTRQRRSRPHKMPRTRAVKRVRKDCIAFLRGAVVSGQPHCATENATLQLVSLVAACRGRAEVDKVSAQAISHRLLKALDHFGHRRGAAWPKWARRQALSAPARKNATFMLGSVPPEHVEEARKGGRPLAPTHSDAYFPVPEPTIKTGVLTMSMAALQLLGR